MERAFGGEGADVVIGGALDVRVALVDAGEDDGAHIGAGALADRQLAGRADLDLVKDLGESAQQEGIRFDREAESDLVAEIFFDHLSAFLERVKVKDIRGGPYAG